VAQTIRAAGLLSFYALRDAESLSALLPDDGGDASVSAAAAAGMIRRVDGGLCEVALLLDGLRCGACVWLIETWLLRQPGVRAASVNFATRRARVRFDDAQTGPAQILRAVARIGYSAHPYDPRRREMLARTESRTLMLRAALA
jgi:Cu2+-exporting ATPase